jgi:excisionase family DNA binding protein
MENIQIEVTQIKQFIKEQSILRKEFLTLEEVTWYLGLSKSCLYKMTSKNEIPFYSPRGKKLYFRKPELDEWVFRNRISSNYELESEVENYLSKPLNL